MTDYDEIEKEIIENLKLCLICAIVIFVINAEIGVIGDISGTMFIFTFTVYSLLFIYFVLPAIFNNKKKIESLFHNIYISILYLIHKLSSKIKLLFKK